MPFDPTTARAASAFDPSSARPAAGFDPSTATPLQQPQQAQPPAQQDESTDIGQKAGGDAGSMLWAALHGAADTATFGLADKASAGLAHLISPLTGQPMSYDEAYAKIQNNNAKSRGNSPISAAVGDVAGMAVGAGGIAKAAGKVPMLARGLEAFAPVANGGTVTQVANVAKSAAAAGLASGGYTAADDLIRKGELDPNNIALNTAVGAVVGPVASKVGTAIARGVQSGSTKAVQVLADKIGETPATLQRVYDNFQAATGRVPSMAEIVGMKSQGELRQLAGQNPIVGEAATTTADTAAAQRPRALAQTVENAGGPAQDISQLMQARTARMTQAMDPIRNSPAAIDQTDVGLLNDPRVRQVIRADPNLSQRVREAIEDAGTNGSTERLTINDIDSIRKSIRGRQSAFANPANSLHNPHMAEQFGNLADNISDLGTAAEPRYQDALDRFRSDSHYIDGFQHGSAGKSIGDAERPDLIAALNEPEGIAGHQAGIVSRTSDAAASSPEGAARAAKDLAAGAGDTATLRRAVGQQGFEDIQNAAAHETRGATSLKAIGPGVPDPAESQVPMAALAHVAKAVASHSPAWVAFHLAKSIPRVSKALPPAIQTQVARYLTDPAMTQQGINLLRRAGATNADLWRLASALSVNAGLNTADTLGQ